MTGNPELPTLTIGIAAGQGVGTILNDEIGGTELTGPDSRTIYLPLIMK